MYSNIAFWDELLANELSPGCTFRPLRLEIFDFSVSSKINALEPVLPASITTANGLALFANPIITEKIVDNITMRRT